MPSPQMSTKKLIDQLKQILDKSSVRSDPDSLKQYGLDWTRRYQPDPVVIVLPKTIDQVVKVVKFANEHKIALVPSGGRTGLSGGAVATNHEIVIAMDRMNNIFEFNELDRTVHCQPGVITEQLQHFAEDKNLFYPVDFASAGSSQIGGNIATNAGGIKVIRYGMTRDWVAGLKVVTGAGELLDLNKGLVRNATGYDLRHLFIGSEGTLGIIVEATMKLCRPSTNLSVMVLGLPDFSGVMNVLKTFQDEIDLNAFEFFSDKAVKHVTANGKVKKPFVENTPFYVLLEFENSSEQTNNLVMTLFDHCIEKEWVLDGVMSQSESQAQALWQLRENISETISEFTPYKNDIAVKISDVSSFVEEVDALVSNKYPDFEIVWFGHIGDGNMHLNILKPSALPKEEFFARCEKVSHWVFEIVQKYQGSISAEHGVGLLKKDYLHYSRSEEELQLMKSLKSVFDPGNILNPGKIFD